MHYTIYKITNIINNKYYIGKHQTKNLNDGYMGSGKLLKRAITKYGIQNFAKEILFVFDNEQDMNAKEKELVVISEQTYNLCPGGQGGFGYINNLYPNGQWLGKPRSSATKQKLSHIGKQRTNALSNPSIRQKATEAHRKKYPNGAFYGKKHTEQTIQKLKKSKNNGEKNSQYGTCWVTNDNQTLKVKKQFVDTWLNQGYRQGRK